MTRRRRALVFHPGTQHSWQTAMALDDLDRLVLYATSIFYQPDRPPYSLTRYLPESVRARVDREFRRFEQPGLDPAKVRTTGLEEWLERIAGRAGFRRQGARLDRHGNIRFGRSIGRLMMRPEQFALWGYNGSAEQGFVAAKARGRTCILDRTIGDWRAYNAVMDEQYEAHPDYFLTADYRIDQAQIDADDREYALADVILTGSPFCAETVRRHAAVSAVSERVRVLSYCYDEHVFGTLPAPVPKRDDPVEFLFLGQAGVRKGFHLLLKAFARIPASAARLTVIGPLIIPPATFARHADGLTYRKTVPRSEVAGLMTKADVFLFPSLFEGAGIVLYEALAAGTAIIQSRFAAEAVTSETGLMLDDVTEDSLFEAMMTVIENRDRLVNWRLAAQTAARTYDFAHYRAGIEDVMRELDDH